jgi:hypothetical protein
MVITDLNRSGQKVKRAQKPITLLLFVFVLTVTTGSIAQSVNFELKTSPNVDFTFNTIDKYVNGITVPHALELDVNVTGSQWDLYIGTSTTAAGEWNVLTSYSTTGISPPPSGILQARIYNISNTPQTGAGFFPLTDIASPTYIIGSNGNDPAVNCSDPSPVGTNQPGDYSVDPECYRFKVDLKLVPGMNYRPGLYNMRVDFILIEDL